MCNRRVWYLMDDAGRYYTGSEWSRNRQDRHIYRERIIAVLIRRALGAYIYTE